MNALFKLLIKCQNHEIPITNKQLILCVAASLQLRITGVYYILYKVLVVFLQD